MRSDKLFILCINQKKSLKKYTITQLSQYNEIALKYKNGCYIYELKNSQTSKPRVLILTFTDKLGLTKGENRISLSNLSIYYRWRNIKGSCNNNKFKISAPTWNDKFELPDGSYSVSDIQDYFEYILKRIGENIDKPSVKIYVKKIENKITFNIKDGYSLELLTPETMILLGSTENKITKDKNG